MSCWPIPPGTPARLLAIVSSLCPPFFVTFAVPKAHIFDFHLSGDTSVSMTSLHCSCPNEKRPETEPKLPPNLNFSAECIDPAQNVSSLITAPLDRSPS